MLGPGGGLYPTKELAAMGKQQIQDYHWTLLLPQECLVPKVLVTYSKLHSVGFGFSLQCVFQLLRYQARSQYL